MRDKFPLKQCSADSEAPHACVAHRADALGSVNTSRSQHWNPGRFDHASSQFLGVAGEAIGKEIETVNARYPGQPACVCYGLVDCAYQASGMPDRVAAKRKITNR